MGLSGGAELSIFLLLLTRGHHATDYELAFYVFDVVVEFGFSISTALGR